MHGYVRTIVVVPGPISTPELLVAACSRADSPGMLARGDAGGIGGGGIFCEVLRVGIDEGCRGLNGEDGTELRSGAICGAAFAQVKVPATPIQWLKGADCTTTQRIDCVKDSSARVQCQCREIRSLPQDDREGLGEIVCSRALKDSNKISRMSV